VHHTDIINNFSLEEYIINTDHYFLKVRNFDKLLDLSNFRVLFIHAQINGGIRWFSREELASS
jgi:hypothetical protein